MSDSNQINQMLFGLILFTGIMTTALIGCIVDSEFDPSEKTIINQTLFSTITSLDKQNPQHHIGLYDQSVLLKSGTIDFNKKPFNHIISIESEDQDTLIIKLKKQTNDPDDSYEIYTLNEKGV